MKIRIFRSARAASTALAHDVARSVARTPQLVLGLPTGKTPIPLYRELVGLCRARAVDFSHVTTFNLDEFVGLSADDPRSYAGFMRRHLFDHVNLSSHRAHVLDGAAADIAAECERYERAIVRAGGIDLMVLGLGRNGHIGFNEPDRTLELRTHRTLLRPSTRKANAFLFGHRLSAVPREAVSMGMGTILEARRIVLLVTGRSKARAVQRAVNGRLTTRVPASFLQLHRDVEVWLDDDSALFISSS